MENVAGIAYKGKAEGLEYLLERIDAINTKSQTNYRVETMRLNAAAYGVPQIRERVFLVAHRDGLPFGQLSPTHFWKQGADDQLLFDESNFKPANTAWDAIGHLKVTNDSQLTPRGKWADLLPSIPEGENYLYHTAANGVVS